MKEKRFTRIQRKPAAWSTVRYSKVLYGIVKRVYRRKSSALMCYFGVDQINGISWLALSDARRRVLRLLQESLVAAGECFAR
jgi:hypothetical protein